MDFTYFEAGFIGIAVGFLTAFVAAVATRRTGWRPILVAFVIALGVDAVLLINWANLDALPPAILIFDFAIIAVYRLVGCALGAFPIARRMRR